MDYELRISSTSNNTLPCLHITATDVAIAVLIHSTAC